MMLAVSEAWAQTHIQQVTQIDEFENGSIITSDEDIYGLFLNSPFLSSIQQLAVDASQIARINIKGNDNTAELTQSGVNNIGVIDITGDSNFASLAQRGNGLFSAVNIDGFSNKLDMSQTGDNLQNMILIEGTGLTFDIVQDASGIELTQTGSSIPLQIQHTGSIIPIIIKNN